MSPPPSTPTARRFLLPKRTTQASASQAQTTPSQPTAKFLSTPKFTQTPRFAAAGSSSAPRPSQLRVEDLDDDDDRVRESEDEEEAEGELNEERKEKKRGDVRSDSIEVESDGSGTPHELKEEDKNSARSEGIGDVLESALPTFDLDRSPPSREAKRRKLSISSLPESSPTKARAGFSVSPDENSDGVSVGQEGYSDDEEPFSDVDDLGSDTDPVSKQPTFRPAPRFKPLEDTLPDGLPVAFSPQRRGAKYIPNGLAATLQGWLSDVKGWEGEDRTSESTFLVTVTEVRAGRRMYLVHAKPDGENQIKKLVLAGEGELTGLGSRTEVGVGSVVKVTGPLWDAEIKGVSWIVACNWSVHT